MPAVVTHMYFYSCTSSYSSAGSCIVFHSLNPSEAGLVDFKNKFKIL